MIDRTGLAIHQSTAAANAVIDAHGCAAWWAIVCADGGGVWFIGVCSFLVCLPWLPAALS